MLKCWTVCLFATAALISLATAQAQSSPAKSGADPIQAATKPLTPKSAMPAQHKSSAAVPASDQKTNAELNHLERQNVKTSSPKSAGAGPAEGASVRSANTTAGTGSGINFKYQKPAGGMTAATAQAHAANTKQRVTKN